MSFRLFGSLFGSGLMLAAIAIGVALPRFPDMWRKLPRERIAGSVIGTGCLIWSAFLVSPLLSESLPLLNHLLPVLVIVLAGLCIAFLEYLLTRALGGLILLCAVQGMALAFNDHTPQRWIFSVFAYVLGIGAMVMIGSPWRFRDLLKQMVDRKTWRHTVAAVLLSMGLTTLILALLTRS